MRRRLGGAGPRGPGSRSPYAVFVALGIIAMIAVPIVVKIYVPHAFDRTVDVGADPALARAQKELRVLGLCTLRYRTNKGIKDADVVVVQTCADPGFSGKSIRVAVPAQWGPRERALGFEATRSSRDEPWDIRAGDSDRGDLAGAILTLAPHLATAGPK